MSKSAHKILDTAEKLFYFIFKKWKIESARHAILVGVIWLGLTILFEFGFGHYFMGNPWQKLLHERP